VRELEPFDWHSSPPPEDFQWVEHGTFADKLGRVGVVGSECELLRPVVTFDEKGGRRGLFSVGQRFKVTALSSLEPRLLYVEGPDSSDGWAMAGVQPEDVSVVEANRGA
jgi:hypothetical protein